MVLTPKDDPATLRSAAISHTVPAHVYPDAAPIGASKAPEGVAAPEAVEAPAQVSPVAAAPVAGSDDRARTASAPASSTPAPKSDAGNGGAGAMMLGGAVAAALGFGACYLLTGGGTDPAFDPAPLEQQITAQGESITALQTRLDELPAAPDLGGLETGLAGVQAKLADIDDVQARLAELSEQNAQQGETISALDERLATVEKRGNEQGEADEAALSAYERELQALREQAAQMDSAAQDASDRLAKLEEDAASVRALSEEMRREAEEARNSADDARRLAAARSALSAIETALAQGGSYAEALGPLSEAVEVPAALAEPAQGGVATLSDLRDEFPMPARAALAAAREAGESGEATGGRVGSFLRSQLNVRSTSVREGASTDAVLSRALAALQAGNLEGALDELNALPPSAEPPLADWRAAARTRAEAVSAATEISQTLTEK